MKKIVLCTELDDHCLQLLSLFKDRYPLEGSTVYLLHCLKKEAYSYDFMTSYYPNKEQMEELAKSVESVLSEKKVDMIGNRSNEEVRFQTIVLQSLNPKMEVIDFLNEIDADIAVVGTRPRGKIENVFHSSFASYLQANANCDVYLIKDKKELS